MLDAGVPREQVLGAMVRSTRYASQRVAGAYGSGLGRSPNRGALVWLDGLRHGMEPEWVQQNVLASPERKAWAAPRSSSDLAVAPWRAVRVGSEWSGDRPSAAEIADTSARLQRDRRLDVVPTLWYSPDAVRSRLDAAFRDVLRRSPTAGEIAWWTPVEVGSDLRTRVLLASTPDILSGCGAVVPTPTPGQVLVDGWAQLQARWVLAHPCADPACAPLVQRLDAGAPRAEVFEAVSRDQASSAVLSVYSGLLKREPDRGAQVWEDSLR